MARTSVASCRSRRTGAVTVEMAIAVPLLFLMIFSAVEFSRMNMIRHTVDEAAYEAARRVIVPGAEASDAEELAERVLRTVGVRNGDIEVTPAIIQNDTPEVVVTVSVPADGNGFIAPRFFRGHSFVGRCRLAREDL